MSDVRDSQGSRTRAEVLGFLLEPGPWRSGVLGVVLDAVSRAMTEDTTVVLGIQDVDVGPEWLAAIRLFMPGPTGAPRARILQRAGSNEDVSAQGLHLVITPLHTTSDLVGGESLVVLTEDDPELVGELDSEPHRAVLGSNVPVTEWSVLAMTTLFDLDGAESILARRDEIAEEVAGDGPHPLWALALAIAADTESADAWVEAVRVIRRSPQPLVGRPELIEVAVAAMAAQEGVAAAHNWQAGLARPEPGPPAAPVRVPSAPILLGRGAVTDLPLEERHWRVAVSCPAAVDLAGLEIDVVAFALDQNDKVGLSADFVFYNAPIHPEGSLRLLRDSATSQTIEIDLARIGEGCARIVVAAVIDGAYSFGELGAIELAITSPQGLVIGSSFSESGTERAMVVAEIYRQSGHWRARAVWQGYINGLAGLATAYGVHVED